MRAGDIASNKIIWGTQQNLLYSGSIILSDTTPTVLFVSPYNVNTIDLIQNGAVGQYLVLKSVGGTVYMNNLAVAGGINNPQNIWLTPPESAVLFCRFDAGISGNVWDIISKTGGFAGPKGEQGEKGDPSDITGPTGAPGAPGDVVNGPDGPPGTAGSTPGDKGTKGPKGDTSNSKGNRGPTGIF